MICDIHPTLIVPLVVTLIWWSQEVVQKWSSLGSGELRYQIWWYQAGTNLVPTLEGADWDHEYQVMSGPYQVLCMSSCSQSTSGGGPNLVVARGCPEGA